SLFFSSATSTPHIYPLSLHDALPICAALRPEPGPASLKREHEPPAHDAEGDSPARTRAGLIEALRHGRPRRTCGSSPARTRAGRSEEHTSELQSRENLVCRLLLEKKK